MGGSGRPNLDQPGVQALLVDRAGEQHRTPSYRSCRIIFATPQSEIGQSLSYAGNRPHRTHLQQLVIWANGRRQMVHSTIGTSDNKIFRMQKSANDAEFRFSPRENRADEIDWCCVE